MLAGTLTTVGQVEGAAEKLWVAPSFVALHVGWGLGFWREVIAVLRRGGGARPALASSASN